MRFSGQATTVKCFENNPLVRSVRPFRFAYLRAACMHGWNML
jgi:regulator of RNase E activity RraA